MVNLNRLHTFTVDITSKDGQRYYGTFTAKKLSVRDMTQVGVRTAQLCGGMKYDPKNTTSGLDADTYGMNSMIAHLEYALTESPEWWNLDELSDLDIMLEVYKEVGDFESNFPRTGSRGDSEGRSEKDKAGADSTGVPQPMVVGEVQASLEP